LFKKKEEREREREEKKYIHATINVIQESKGTESKLSNDDLE
jgi:hypothetical protein